MRRLAVVGVALYLVPTVGVIALVRPAGATVRAAAPAPGPALGRFALTTSAAAVVSSGNVGAGGGLILTDQGAATVGGRLDNAPSAKTTAVAAEPGETLRTLSATEGGPTAPGAQATYPGGPPTSSDATVGMTSADATEYAADAAATAASAANGPGNGDAASASATMTSDAGADLLSASTTSDSGTVTVAGVLSIAGVVGTAAVSYDAGGHHASAGITVTSASVAGLPVTIDAGGVHAAGASAPLPGAPADPNAVLAAAGITVTYLSPVMTSTTSNALADSGALVIHVVTQDVTSGVTTVSSANDVTLSLGHAVATLSDAAPLPRRVPTPVARPTSPAAQAHPSVTVSPTRSAPPSVRPRSTPSASRSAVVVPGRPGRSAVPGRTVTAVIGGGPPPVTAVLPPLPSAPVEPPALAPSVVLASSAAPAVAVPPAAVPPPGEISLAGYHIAETAALAGFGAWQLLTLGIATTATLVLRRRGEEEEHLCPCP